MHRKIHRGYRHEDTWLNLSPHPPCVAVQSGALENYWPPVINFEDFDYSIGSLNQQDKSEAPVEEIELCWNPSTLDLAEFDGQQQECGLVTRCYCGFS